MKLSEINAKQLLTADVFDLLLGDNLQGRKEHIAEVGNQYIEFADISFLRSGKLSDIYREKSSKKSPSQILLAVICGSSAALRFSSSAILLLGAKIQRSNAQRNIAPKLNIVTI